MSTKKTLAVMLAAAILPVAVWAQEEDPIEELKIQVTALTLVSKQLQIKVGNLETANTALTTRVTVAEAAVAGHDSKLAKVSVSSDGTQFILEGANLVVRNGSGATTGVNGLGNIIIGYDEFTPNYGWYDAGGFGVEKAGGSLKTGSHNLILGYGNSYTSYGGIVASEMGRVTQPYASLVGGLESMATGYSSTVTGGYRNNARGHYSSVAGGTGHNNKGYMSTVAGGYYNVIDGSYASIGGGAQNSVSANGAYASVAGGYGNQATAYYTAVLGGHTNKARKQYSAIVGGQLNTTDGDYTTVLGGILNNVSATSLYGAIVGGRFGQVTHNWSTVLGGSGSYSDRNDDYAPF